MLNLTYFECPQRAKKGKALSKRITIFICLIVTLFSFSSCKVKTPTANDAIKTANSEKASEIKKYKDYEENEDYIYSVNEAGVTLVKYIGENPEVTIPQNIEERNVVEIGNSCFAGSGITSLVISRNVTTVQSFAFYNCEKLETITIKDGVKCIGGSAFAHCSSLKAVDFPGSVNEIKECAFSNCTSLSSVSFIGERNLKIGAAAFSNTCINRLMLPQGCESISNAAFINCKKLKEVYVPDSVKDIKNNAFKGCPSVTLYVLSDSYGEAFAKTAKEKYKVI